MAPRYPVLDNRPIDQWKVTELKEELKRRKLTIKGLKEDLIKRLDEAIRIERANDEKANGFGSDSESEDLVRDAEVVPDVADVKMEIINQEGDENKSKDNIPIPTEIKHGIALSEAGVALYGNDSFRIEEKIVSHASDDQTSVVIPETVVSQAALSEHGGQNIETEDEDMNLKPQLKAPQVENEDLKHDLEINALKPSKEDLIMPNPSSPKNQALEVSRATGSVITSDAITTDTVTINETIEIKDNISAENVKLELDVKLETVEPSSNIVVAADGKSHPMDIEEPLENTAFVGEKDDSSGTDTEISKNVEVVDVGCSEKLNLDRSSGDDSMEEDALESKQVESKCNPEEEDTREKSEVTIIKHEFHESIIKKESYSEFVGDKKEPNVEKNDHSPLLAEKRKFPDHAVVGNEPGKRQRRWNTENIKLPEQKGSNLTPSATPKDTSLSTDEKQFSRSDSTVSESAAKERVVPPSLISPSNSLRIVNFLRPFTLKAVQELLGKTGTVTSFWMDHIKTHCYVTFSSVEEAVETRNAVYNLQWPPNGGRLLAAEFVDPQEVKKRVEAPKPPTPTTTTALVVPSPVPALHPQPTPRQPQQQLPPLASLPPLPPFTNPPQPKERLPLPPPPPFTNPPQAKERLSLPPPPPIVDKIEAPIVTLDDLFRKTKATPRIYYLPLSDDQVAAKLTEEGKRTKT